MRRLGNFVSISIIEFLKYLGSSMIWSFIFFLKTSKGVKFYNLKAKLFFLKKKVFIGAETNLRVLKMGFGLQVVRVEGFGSCGVIGQVWSR